jgi:predicted translin family RNA/ssDNA-binding protein
VYRPQCGQACQEDKARDDAEYWAKKHAYDKWKKDQKEAKEARKAANKAIEQANKLSAEAYKFKQAGDCTKAVALYSKALALTDLYNWRWHKADCMQKLHNDDEAYAAWEQMIKDPR